VTITFEKGKTLTRKETVPSYIVAQTTSFSGATLLAFLLNNHSQIATVAEMEGLVNVTDYENYSCSCGQKVKKCVFWQSIKHEMSKRGFEFDVANFGTRLEMGGPRLIQYLRRGSTRINAIDTLRDTIFYNLPSESRRLKALVARNEALIDSVLDITDKEIFFDTSKRRLRLRVMHKFSKFNVRAIHLVRDVRGVVASNLRRDSSITAAEAARNWAKLHHRHKRLLATLPTEAYIRLRYEDLCRDVSATLEKLYNFFGVDPTVRVTDFRNGSHHMIGSTMRLRSETEIKLDERWKTMLTNAQLEEIDQVAGNLRREFGYK